MHLRSTEKEQSSRLFFPSTSVNLGLKCDFSNWMEFTFFVVNGSFKAFYTVVHICESGVRNWSAGVIRVRSKF